MAGQPAIADSLLALLPHRVRRPGGIFEDANASSMNPAFMTANGVTRNAALQAIVNRRVLEEGVRAPKHPELRRLRFALVDMSGPAKSIAPQFSGHDELLQGGLGSMAKLACMFAAFQLKSDLEELSVRKGISVEKDLFTAARDIWTDAQKRDATNVQTLFPADPKIEQLGRLIEVDGKTIPVPRPFSAPDLEHIFTSTKSGPGLKLSFRGSDLILVDATGSSTVPHTNARVEAYVRSKGEKIKQVRQFTFAERLFLMVDDSDGAATHTCIENVSFWYIASSLWQNDLYRPERGGGLWEGSTHDGTFRWRLPPSPLKSRAVDFVSATAASMAAMLTLLEQDRLVNPEASSAMKHLMNKDKVGLRVLDRGRLISVGSYTRSFFSEELERRFRLDRVHSKLGIASALNDGLIVARTVRPDPADPSKTVPLLYVAAGFDSSSPTNLHTLIVQLDRCILEHNGLLAPNAP